ncbi:hypothetical protein [Gramella sp. AN32]|uniref:SdiA-regulated domain-containing protein n=1 Tax=Christiangramia antarctica TaxID=2058158 RepID=A0ABW5X9I4_9FLAO|nr:hypothetical protein [Gramella sp. AN32]MCM4157355.1 hypothetical protein [Gramella sp. AN32]
MNKWAIGIIFTVILLALAIYGLYEMKDVDFDDFEKTYEIVNKWTLPNELEEISAIAWLGNNKIACVQDEDGIIYTYDLNSAKIIAQTEFYGEGDYEGMTLLNNEFYITESDGQLYRIATLDSATYKPEVIETDFDYTNDIEGLTSLAPGKLLFSVKGKNFADEEDNYKGLYEYDIQSRKLDSTPKIKITLTIEDFEKISGAPGKELSPSDIAVHPTTGNLYILDGEHPKLIIIDTSGKLLKYHLLDPEEFFLPEGICFTPNGRMFISNEGKGGDPNILEVKLLK